MVKTPAPSEEERASLLPQERWWSYKVARGWMRRHRNAQIRMAREGQEPQVTTSEGVKRKALLLEGRESRGKW